MAATGICGFNAVGNALLHKKIPKTLSQVPQDSHVQAVFLLLPSAAVVTP
jgi:hypothetical protein